MVGRGPDLIAAEEDVPSELSRTSSLQACRQCPDSQREGPGNDQDVCPGRRRGPCAGSPDDIRRHHNWRNQRTQEPRQPVPLATQRAEDTKHRSPYDSGTCPQGDLVELDPVRRTEPSVTDVVGNQRAQHRASTGDRTEDRSAGSEADRERQQGPRPQGVQDLAGHLQDENPFARNQ